MAIDDGALARIVALRLSDVLVDFAHLFRAAGPAGVIVLIAGFRWFHGGASVFGVSVHAASFEDVLLR